jgi:hypothetical protein
MSKTTKTHIRIWRIVEFGFVIPLVFSILNFGFAKRSFAQTLGLSISPPIDEIMIMPGKEVTQTFTITNDGNDGMASVYIIPFRPSDEGGNVTLDEKNAVVASSPFASWFSITSPAVAFGEKFYMAGGQRMDIAVKISPPSDAVEKDYYFTLLYELDGEVPGSFAPIGPTNQARIGANLLISISKDGKPKKNPNIIEFSAPRLIDSLGKLVFNIRLGNYGSYLYKPEGKITIKPNFGSSETLTLAPYNVLSDSVRNVPCINGEETVPCQSSHKVLVGIYKSTLEISADGSGAPQEKTVTTVAFPFSIIFVLIFTIVTYKIIKNAKNKATNPIDKSFHKPNNKF